MKTIPAETLSRLALEYGTPLWVYDAAVIRERIRQLGMFDVIRYAQKANSNINILKLMREAGVHVDSVSIGEIERAQMAGYTAADMPSGAAGIVYTADIFDRQTLERVVADKIEVNAGSTDMLQQLGEASRGHRVWLRINPGFGHGHSKKTNTGGETSKHGIWHGELAHAVDLVRRFGLRLVGLHLHIGSGVDYGHLQKVCDAMTDLLHRVDHDIEAISAGGGLSVPYRKDDKSIDTAHYFELWDAVRKGAEKRFGHALRLEIEPGRFLVAESGFLVGEVRATKQMGANHFTLIDAGFNDLVRPAMYGAWHEMAVITRDGQIREPSNLPPTVIAGPLCESGDVFTQNSDSLVEMRNLAAAEVGDFVVFQDAGAYGAAMSSNYNSRRQAPEYLLDGASSRLIRRRQTLAELYSGEILS